MMWRTFLMRRLLKLFGVKLEEVETCEHRHLAEAYRSVIVGSGPSFAVLGTQDRPITHCVCTRCGRVELEIYA